MSKWKFKVEKDFLPDVEGTTESVEYADIFVGVKSKAEKRSFGELYDSQFDEDNMTFSYGLLNYDFEHFDRAGIEYSNNAIVLYEFFIEEKNRGKEKGLTDSLMKEVIKHAFMDLNKDEIILEAYPGWKKIPFESLKRFYERFGFKQINNTQFFRLSSIA